MKKLTDILKNTPVREVCGDTAAAIGGLVYDSRAVKPGDCFFAVPGTQSDGHDYIPMAVEKGAAAIVCERMPADAAEGVAYVLVGDSAGAMADMAAAFYDYPSRELKLVGITGTNGKTTTATLLYDLVRAMGYKAGLISTVVYKIDGREVEATHTTPDSIRLNAMMREMADAGCAYCFMECSSHAIVQERTRGLDFAGGIFSNITHDHLDYHKTFAEYIRAKKLFFDGLPKGAFALTNADDRNGRVMVQNTAAAVSAYSLRAMADFRCKIVEMHLDGMLLRIDGQELWVGLLGRFNAYNLLAVYGAAALLGLDRGEVLRVLSMLHAVSGRFEKIRAANGTTAIVDYAHTPDALENVIQTIEEIRTPGQQLIVVCGCGGDRDRTKRPGHCREVCHDGGFHLRQSAPRVARGDSRRHGRGAGARCALPAHRRPRRGDPHGRDALASGRHHPRGGQGARNLSDCRRRETSFRRPGRDKEALCASQLKMKN